MTRTVGWRTALGGALGWTLLGCVFGGCGTTAWLGDVGTAGRAAGGAGAVTNTGGASVVPSTGGTGVVPAEGGSGGYWTGPQSKSAKLDLLFVVDNSLSMADKQRFLQQAVPQMLKRLITPSCLDAYGSPNGTFTDTNGHCVEGTPEFQPIDDIHVGVVSSSLGGRGKPCTPGSWVNPFDDDKGHLVGSLRNSGTAADGTDITYPTYADQGFLAWDAKGTGDNRYGPGLSDKTALIDYFNRMVAATGEQGCGYESTHEAWYRFLVDPEPPSDIVMAQTDQGPQTIAVIDPVDQTVLNQRAVFLRPDSAVAVVVLSDEDDCSIIDYGQGWLVAGNDQPIPRPTSQCAVNPNDPCCRNCQQIGGQFQGCPSTIADPNCQAADIFLPTKDNAPNLRCWQTKRRFGFDMLFDTRTRYVEGLTSSVVLNRSNQSVPNPLFAGGRSPSLVTLVGIVGVPWQDLATDDTLDPAVSDLKLMTHDQMSSASLNRWDVILGNPNPGGGAAPIQPLDPFMAQSIEPRSGNNPITGQPIVNGGTNPLATINGHEYNVNPDYNDDLQYACTFQLPQEMVRDCTASAYTGADPTVRRGCDCRLSSADSVVDRNRPLCQQPAGGPSGTTQYFAKAYPAMRHLQIVKGMGPRGIVGSICPKTSDPAQASSPAYGYNAVVNATIARLRSAFY